MNWDFFIFFVNALAVYRGTKLIIDDKITEPAREWFFDRWSPVNTWTYLFTCPWCVSIWLAGIAVAGQYLIPQVWFPIALVGALAAVTGLITIAEEK
jgi:hypothetical protein